MMMMLDSVVGILLHASSSGLLPQSLPRIRRRSKRLLLLLQQFDNRLTPCVFPSAGCSRRARRLHSNTDRRLVSIIAFLPTLFLPLRFLSTESILCCFLPNENRLAQTRSDLASTALIYNVLIVFDFVFENSFLTSAILRTQEQIVIQFFLFPPNSPCSPRHLDS